MKALVVYLGRKGGGSVYSLELARALAKRIEVRALVAAGVENRAAWELADFPVYFVPTYRGLASAALSFLDFRRFCYIRNVTAGERPDVVHYPMLHPWAPLLNRVAFAGLPKVVTVHDPRPHKGEENWLLTRLQAMAVRQSDRVIILSESLRDTLVAMGWPADAVDVIPHGEFSYYRRYARHGKEEAAVANNSNKLLFFGRIREYKGLDVLLRAFPLVLKEVPDAQLQIVGSGDLAPYRRLLENLPQVQVVNRWVDDDEVAKFFAGASLVVVPYIEASQSGVIPIAYSMGVPVVASATGGLREQVEDGASGFLVPPGDHVALAKRCVELLRDPGLRARLAEGGRRMAEVKMNWDRIADLTVSCYERAITKLRA